MPPGKRRGVRVLRRALAVSVVLAALGSTALISPTGASAAYTVAPDRLTGVTGCRNLFPGEVGVKVQVLQRRLGLRDRFEIMDSATVAALKATKRRLGLPATSAVGARTWRALGITEDWCIDRYQATVELPAAATPLQRRAQVIRYAKRQLGQEYVWGGAGPRGYGFDCAGLVLQALYSAGIDPTPVTIDKHLRPDYRTTIGLYQAGRKVPVRKAVPGDLVFFSNGRYISHMAIYLGNGRTIEASSSADRVRYGTWARGGRLPYVVRVA